MIFQFPRVFPILDSSFIPALGRGVFLERLGRSLADAGITLLEYRNKPGTDAEVLADALILRAALPASDGIRLILDDRIDVAQAANFDGVHVDTGDLPPSAARALLDPSSLIGTSAGNEDEFLAGILMPVDYIAFGPVFRTSTKQTAGNPIGIEGVKRFCETARGGSGGSKILVAAAGITLETAGAVLAAGADCVAAAAGIFGVDDPAAEFRRWMKALG